MKRLAAAGALLAAILVGTPVDLRAEEPMPKIAAIVTSYHHNSHADVLVSRLIQSQTLDGKGEFPRLKLASLYTDQVPERDVSRALAAKYGFPIYPSVAEALTLGGDKLAVDGILLIAEHGDYPESPTGSIVYPKRRLFAEVVRVFEQSGKRVPIYFDKHLSDNWEDAKWIYDTARRLNIPMMAGSSLPLVWRYPAIAVRRNEPIEQLVATNYGRLDTYGFHALEMVQALVERREGGESGVRRVQCLVGDAVWEAGRKGVYDEQLLAAALARLRVRPISQGRTLQQLIKEPVLYVIDYEDGLRASILTLNTAVSEWSAAWRYSADRQIESTVFWTQEKRPFFHFAHLLAEAEKMMHTGEPAWPLERTLLTSGTLDALLISKKENSRPIETPFLRIPYQTKWEFSQPPPPPPGRPLTGP